MSDIPDWLRELATESDQEGALGGDSSVQDEGSEPAVNERSAESVDSPPIVEITPAAEIPDEALSQPTDQDELDLMEQLRSQVDVEEEEVAESSSPGLSFSIDDLLIGGLEPIQQFVLAVLLFLDVLVIGLLFLVMLGRLAI